MIRNSAVLLTCLAVSVSLAAPSIAGVVFEVETTDHEQSPPKVETHQIAAQGKNLTMNVPGGSKGADGEMIYRGDRREMVIVDHANKSYMVFDQETLEQLAAQVGQVSRQMEEMMKNVPESQRAAIEQMMKGKMPQQTAPARKTTEIEKTGERKEVAGYPCVKYIVLRDGVRVSELWVTDWDNVEGGDEIAGVFRDMAAFLGEMIANLSSGLGSMAGEIDDGLLSHFEEIDGFPVVTSRFEGDSLENEATLRSATRRNLDPAEFEPPSGYKRQTMIQ